MKVAIFQSQADGLTRLERTNLLEQQISGDNYDVVVTPELFMSGHNIGNDIQILAEPSDGKDVARAGESAGIISATISHEVLEKTCKRLSFLHDVQRL